MKTKIEKIKVVKEIIESEINFPYIGWWSNKKEDIIKMYYEYYEHNTKIPKHLKCIIIRNGWDINSSITSKTISVHNGVINGDIIPILRDYADLATEEEFQEFREKTLKELI
jgi:hypothetical protein